jgi:hypothetical protein
MVAAGLDVLQDVDVEQQVGARCGLGDHFGMAGS